MELGALSFGWCWWCKLQHKSSVWLDLCYLPVRSDVRVSDVVEVFVNSIQQPEEEFLGIVLGVPLELQSTPGHHVLPNKGQTSDFS